MRRPRFLRSADRSAPAGAATATAPPEPDDSARAVARRELAEAHGWRYTERNQRAIQGWPRTALPPGPIGRVRHEVAGRHRGRLFRLFDYVHHGERDAPWQTIEVYAVALPVPVPYLYIRDSTGDARDIYAEGPETQFAVELLTESLRDDIREHGFTDLVLDRDVLICTSDGGGPRDPESRIEALTGMVERVPADVWARWGMD
ncbi:hypothetical protein ACFPZ0_24890 [Streptomonospora nanhaiensis]|uniref:hypothetical protein n=1 Tax=Streptomonospora nanhaiensis TaxID=1323731 RepID=UPI001FECAD35|nr:hypothetical protein [Streptomonospora nanhaiensis]